MIVVTSGAKELLAELKDAANVDDTKSGLRLASAAGGELGLFPDEARPGDQVVEHAGATVLLVEEELAAVLDGTEMDREQSPEGVRIVLKRTGGAEGAGPSA